MANVATPTEPKYPEPRDDDAEEVSDKLSIGAVMWGRGDREGALSFVRRAAESASDAEQDMRALELAKAASELASFIASLTGTPAPTGQTQAPPAQPALQRAPTGAPPAQAAPRPQTSAPPAAAGAANAPGANRPPPKPSVRPPSSRPNAAPPGGKLPPLPPVRPLGTANAGVTPLAKPSSPRIPSMVTSAGGYSGATTNVASGSIPSTRDAAPDSARANANMPWDERDDEPTNQVDVRGDRPLPDLDDDDKLSDLDKTAIHDAVDPELLKAMQEPTASDGKIRAAAESNAPPPPISVREAEGVATPRPSGNVAPRPAGNELPTRPIEVPPNRLLDATPRPMAVSTAPVSDGARISDDNARSTREPPYLPIAVAMRVRLIAEDGAVRVVPDDGATTEGAAAFLLPANADDDLRTVFMRAFARMK